MMKPFACADDDMKASGLAGTWYPGAREELVLMLDGFLTAAGDLPQDIPSAGDIGVIVSPHAGYPFSGGVAAYGFKAVRVKKVSTVIVLAPTHHFSFQGAAVWPKGRFTTPLGAVAVDEDLAGRLMAADKLFVVRRDVFEGAPGRPENSVETQIPFIQHVFPGAKIVPVIMGFPPDPATVRAVAAALVQAVGRRQDVLVDVSVDQSHFHPLGQANDIDRKGLAAIETFDPDAFWSGHVAGEMEVDGFHVVTAAMLYARAMGYDQARVLRHATSADVTGDARSVVGYASVVFYRKPAAQLPVNAAALTEAQKKSLLAIARSTVDTFVRTGKTFVADGKDPRLSREEGAFVTLKKSGALRGCIGQIVGAGPLYLTVRDMAVAAASQDPRFAPVTADELKDVRIEISVLSAPVAVTDARQIVMGTHGVIVRRGARGRSRRDQAASR